jgi:hypothetical protein
MKTYTFNSKQESSIVGKAMEQNVKDFSNEEIHRVYKNCINPAFCEKMLLMLIKNGLTIEHLQKRNFFYNF